MIKYGDLILYYRTTDKRYVLEKEIEHKDDLKKVFVRKNIDEYDFFVDDEESEKKISRFELERDSVTDKVKILIDKQYLTVNESDYSTDLSSVFGDLFIFNVDYMDDTCDAKIIKADELCDVSPDVMENHIDFSFSAKENTICLVCAVRNEGIYLPHWIDYHRNLGIDHFFIYQNNNTDGSEGILNILNELPFVTVINNTVNESKKSPQKRAYTHAFVTQQSEVRSYEWCVVIDSDEYIALSPVYGNSIKQFLQSFPSDVTSISLCWQFSRPCPIYSENDLLVPLPVRNPQVIDQKYIGDGYRLLKTIFKTKYVVSTTPHFPFWRNSITPNPVLSDGSPHQYLYNPPPYQYDPIFTDKLCFVQASIVHFFTKSPTEFMLKLCRSRGFDPYVEEIDISRLLDPMWVNPFVQSLTDTKTARSSPYSLRENKTVNYFPYMGVFFQTRINTALKICAHKTWENFQYILDIYKINVKGNSELLNIIESKMNFSSVDELESVMKKISSFSNNYNASVISSMITYISSIPKMEYPEISREMMRNKSLQDIKNGVLFGDDAVSKFISIFNNFVINN